MIGPLGRLVICKAVRLAYQAAQEWRRLDQQVALARCREEMSCVASTIERAPAWDFDRRSPATRRTGFNLPEVCMIHGCGCTGEAYR